MSRESFTCYRSVMEGLEGVDDATFRRLMTALMRYALDDQETEFFGLENTVFCAWKASIDASNKRKDNGKNGGRPPKKPMVTEEETNGFEDDNQWLCDAKPTKTETVTETETITETVTETETETETETVTETETGKGVWGETILSDPVKAKLQEWLSYKAERRENYKPTGMKALITQVQKKEQEFGALTVIDCINTAMANGWKGIQWERARSGTQSRSLDDYMLRVINGGAS